MKEEHHQFSQSNNTVIAKKVNSITKNNKLNMMTLVIVGLLLLGVVGYSGYNYGSRKSNSGVNVSNHTAITSHSSFHSVEYDTPGSGTRYAIKLAFPENYQAIALDNGSNTFRSLFGDDSGNYIYHGGDWQIGKADNGSGESWGEIGIMGIAADWYTRNGFAKYGGFNNDSYASDPMNTTINGYDFSTPTKKNVSLEKLISDTLACANDSSKGFSISGLFNVCYYPMLIKQAYAAYDSTIQFSGYAKINDIPYVMFGWVSIDGGLEGSNDVVLNKAGEDFKAGKIPIPTQKNIDTFIAALKNSTITKK